MYYSDLVFNSRISNFFRSVGQFFFGLQEQQEQDYGNKHYDGQLAEIGSQTSGIGGAAEHQCDGISGKNAHHIHDPVGCGTVFLWNNLTENRHVVGIEHPVTNTE